MAFSIRPNRHAMPATDTTKVTPMAIELTTSPAMAQSTTACGLSGSPTSRAGGSSSGCGRRSRAYRGCERASDASFWAWLILADRVRTRRLPLVFSQAHGVKRSSAHAQLRCSVPGSRPSHGRQSSRLRTGRAGVLCDNRDHRPAVLFGAAYVTPESQRNDRGPIGPMGGAPADQRATEDVGACP